MQNKSIKSFQKIREFYNLSLDKFQKINIYTLEEINQKEVKNETRN